LGERSEQRALYNTCLRLQGDIREVQQRAAFEGCTYTVLFSLADNSYKIGRSASIIDRTVPFEKGVSYNTGYTMAFKDAKLVFTSNGTVSGKGGTIYLKSGRFTREITILPVSGRALIGEQK